MDNLDWNQLKAFLQTAQTGSLSAAARKLGLTQPTLSRQVAAIEQQMGVTRAPWCASLHVAITLLVALMVHASWCPIGAASMEASRSSTSSIQ